MAMGGRNPGLNTLGGGNRISPTGFNRGRNGLGTGGLQGRQGLGWRNPYMGYHQNWMRGNGGYLGGNRMANINNINNNNFYGRGGGGWGYGRGYGGYGGWGYPGWGRGGWGNGRGWGGYGGWGYGGWGYPGFGLGFGLGWGLGSLGFGGWGLGGWGYGLGGLGWGLGGLGYGGWGLGGLGYGGGGWGGWGGGYGLSSWLYGPMLYDWGYSSYANPYYIVPSTVVVEQPTTVYDYTQPINPTVIQPAESVTDQAMSLFDQARSSFKNGDYTAALDLTDQAIRQLPNDPTLHEFRSLALFALKRYEDAATPLYAVLSLGPGWDWPTLIGLYPNVDVYTAQLRDLEARVEQNPASAPLRFVLAYHYMAEGHTEAALAQFKEITRLQPRDSVSAQIVQQLQKAAQGLTPTTAIAPAGAGGAPAPSPSAAGSVSNRATTPSRPPGNLLGTWEAKPSDETTIRLTFADGGHFTWQVNQQGKTHDIQGDQTFGNGILTLAQSGQEAQPPMVGRLTWDDRDHFTFKLIGGPPDDPGLHFSRTP